MSQVKVENSLDNIKLITTTTTNGLITTATTNGESVTNRKQKSESDSETESSSISESSSPIHAALNELLLLSKKPSKQDLTNEKQNENFNNNNNTTTTITTNGLTKTSSEYFDKELILLRSPSYILTPCPSPTPDKKRIHRVVLTGGPCAGKTTSINRIRNFFENIGWRVFCVPETASLLLGSGIFFYDLGKHTIHFQENLLKTLLQIEDSINETAKFYHNDKNQNCIIIYDRGAMDPVAYLSNEDWETLKSRNSSWNEVDLRDNRYDQIIHLITAANGAEQHYVLENNICRTEGIEMARLIDEKCARAWIGHPYIDVIDNCTDFEIKIARVLQAVCNRIGLKMKGFDIGNRKRKFLVKTLPDANEFPPYQDFNVIHNYLVSNSPRIQARIRKRGQSNIWSYTYTVRVKEDDQIVETRTQIDKREYAMLLKTIDTNHHTIYKLRRCFEWHHRYFQLDVYEEPCNPCCRGLAILSTYCISKDLVLPKFIQIEKEITDDPSYSMFNLSLKKRN